MENLKNSRCSVYRRLNIEEKFEKGKIGMAHFSDLLRISLLAKWGGMWIDSTALCTDEDFFRYASKQHLVRMVNHYL